MLRTIKSGFRNARKVLRNRREVRCHELLSKEFPSVNYRGIRQTLIINEYKVGYNMIHKNGSSSMMVLWNAVLSGSVESPQVCLRKLRHLSSLRESEIPQLKAYRWMLIVRNPYARVLSAFFDKFRREKITSIHGSFDLTPEGFKDFIKWLEDGNLDKNPHWNLQVSEILLPVSAFSDVIRLENLHDDVQAYFSKIGVPVTNLDFNAAYDSGSAHQTGSDSRMAAFYEDDVQERVYSLYEADFLNLGYGRNLDGTSPAKHASTHENENGKAATKRLF